MEKRSRYSFSDRPEIVELVPRGARIIVDVGCGDGRLGATLKRRSPLVEVRGVEPEPVYAARAAGVLDDVFCGHAEKGLPIGWPVPDCVVFGDVLEHMAEPWSVLRDWRTQMRRNATLVVSVPNIAHWSIWAGLLRGAWDYSNEGILDWTHLRFFTGPTSVELIERAGYRIEIAERVVIFPETAVRLKRRFRVNLRSAPENPYRAVWRTAKPSRWRYWQRLGDLMTYQFLFAARRT